MKPYLITNISTKGAVKIDIKKTIKNDPHRPGQEMYLENAGGVWHFQKQEIFNDAWVEQFEATTNLWVTGAFVFWRKADYQHPGAHIDTYPRDGVLESIPASFNWVLDRDPFCHMTWYKPWWDADDPLECERAAQGLIPHPSAPLSQADYGTMSYQETDPDLLEEIERISLGTERVTMCRTNIPHTVWMSDRDRWCVSLRFGYEHAPKLWQDLVSRAEHFALGSRT